MSKIKTTSRKGKTYLEIYGSLERAQYEKNRRVATRKKNNYKHTDETKEKIRQKLLGRKSKQGSIAKRKKTMLERYPKDYLSKVHRAVWEKRTTEEKEIIIERLVESNTGRKCSFVTREKIRKGNLGKKSEQSSIEKLKKTMLERYSKLTIEEKRELTKAGREVLKQKKIDGTLVYPDRSGVKNNMYGVDCPKKSFVTYNGVAYRSNWEVLIVKTLEKENIKYKYEPKRFYLGDLTYLPDFFIPDFNYYIEVKGWLKRNKRDIERIDRFRKEHKLFLITSKEIKALKNGASLRNMIIEVIQEKKHNGI